MKSKLILIIYLSTIVHARLVSGIFGGHNVSPNAFPNIVAIKGLAIYPSSESLFCGGIIYNPRWISCAGSCVIQIGIAFPRENLSVLAGKWQFNGHERYEQVRGVSIAILHDKYDPPHIGRSVDLGLIKLTAALLFNDFVKALPFSSLLEYPSGHVVILGWGCSTLVEEHFKYTSSVLQIKYETLINYNACQFAVRRILRGLRIQLTPLSFIGDRFCTGTFTNVRQGPSYGDAGGPVMQRNASGIYEVIGVITVGVKIPNLGLHMHITHFLEWIENMIKDYE